jgi:hypothetical protein
VQRKLGLTKVVIPKTGEAEITISVPVDGLRDLYEKSSRHPHPQVLLQKDYVRRTIGRAIENIRFAMPQLDSEVHPSIEYKVED